MEVFDQIINEFSSLPRVREWEEAQALFRRVASGRPRHWLLPLRVCEAVGGTVAQAIPAIVSVACSHIGIVLVDDMLDTDPRGEHVRVGEGAAANMASALQSAALAAILRCDMASSAKLAALESVNEMFLATTLGQHWDANLSIVDEESYWKIAKAKSSPFFGAAFQIGALAGGASADLSARFRELGNLYGEMIQIHDDAGDTLALPVNPDWGADRAPLPILFARRADHPQKARFEELYPNAGTSPEALKEAQEILIQCGAISYCVYHLLNRNEMAGGILSDLPLARRGIMEKIFEDAVRPVHQLFEEADKTSRLMCKPCAKL